MHRRNLTVRRFGAMSFGLGYFEDGVWVDHSAAGGPVLDVVRTGGPDDSDRVDPTAIHQWYTCCTEPAIEAEAAAMLNVAGHSAP